MTSAETSGVSPTLRVRAGGVLRRACDDGLLDDTLEKWAGDPRHEQITDAVPNPMANTGDTDTSVKSAAFNSEAPANASDSAAPTQRRKKKDRGRSLAAALALGDQQGNPDFEPTPEQRRCSVPTSVDIMPSASVSKSSFKSRRATVADPREVHAAQLVEQEKEIQRRAEAKQRKKFAEGVRQAKVQEEKLALHQKRVEYIDNKLKNFLEKLVAEVSARTARDGGPGRPANPVPLMIEVLAEIAEKPVASFKNVSPGQRIRREIADLEQQIAQYQEMYDNGDRFTQGSDNEAELPDDLDVTIETG